MRNHLALLLVGQARTYQRAWPLFERNLIVPMLKYYQCESCDVFLVLDTCDQLRSSGQCAELTRVDHFRVFEVIEANGMRVRQYRFCGGDLGNRQWPETYRRVIADNWSKIPDRGLFYLEERAIISWSLFREAILLMETYEKAHNFRYNVVIKSRLDLALNSPFNCQQLDLGRYIYSFSHMLLMGSRDHMVKLGREGVLNYGLYTYTGADLDKETHYRFNFTSEMQTAFLIRSIADEYSLREHYPENPFVCLRTDTEIVLRPWNVPFYQIPPCQTREQFEEWVTKL